MARIDIASGEMLDKIGEMYGVKRNNFPAEPDRDYQKRILDSLNPAWEVKTISPEELDVRMGVTESVDPHANHIIVENWAGGKRFMYCRQCKVEVA